MPPNYQTIIIGAGPAGLTAGRYLGDALIIEQKKEVGRPVQCVGISKNALKIQRIRPNFLWACSETYKVERIMPNGKIIGTSHKRPIGYVVEKFAFEKFLATKLKAKIKLNAKVIGITKKNSFYEVAIDTGEIFTAKYIIAADGTDSIVGKKFFKSNEDKKIVISGTEYQIKIKKPINTKIIQMYFDREKYPNGYLWVFPRTNYIINVGVEGDCNFPETLNLFLKDTIKKQYSDYQILGSASGTVFFKKRGFKLFKSNVILTGNAAGLVDPIFRAGTIQAMISANIAAQSIINNEVDFYESKIESLPFSDSKLIEANKIFYSFTNQMLNKLGEYWTKKSFSDIKIFSKHQNKLLKFISIWGGSKNWLW